MAHSLDELRAYAISHSLFTPATLNSAVDRIGFIQADPIRSPSTAQDLILRHRVQGYRAGDLHRQYPALDVEEGYLYAYGFLRRDLWQLRRHSTDPATLPEFDQKVLAAVQSAGPTHPKSLEAEFGKERTKNYWGGHSKATTRALERLHWHGLLRVSHRETGIRVYAPAPKPLADRGTPAERLRKLVLAEATVLAPVSKSTLQWLASGLRRISFPGEDHRAAIADLLRRGELESGVIDGITYLWPACSAKSEEQPRVVRFLAPFDPIVWDRHRFEHLWGWEYRFEAYTPAAKRVRGYYALPLLWREHVIGWANARVAEGSLDVEVGFVENRPKEKAFQQELDAEVACLEAFLALDKKTKAATG